MRALLPIASLSPRFSGHAGSSVRRHVAAAAIAGLTLGLSTGLASAAAVFSSAVSLTATLSLGNGAALSGLGFAASSSFYDAGAIVGIPGGYQVSATSLSVDRQFDPSLPYDQATQGGGIAALIFSDENAGMTYPRAAASASNGVASAGGTPSGSGASFAMNSDISGAAYPERGFAAASMRWQATTFFTNLTSSDLLVIWTVNYTLTASAHVDDPSREKAITETQLFAGLASQLPTCSASRCPFDSIAAADPPLDPPVSEIPIRPNPPPAAGAIQYQVRLAPGASDRFGVAIDQFGFAQVVPLPPALPLVLAALGSLAAVARRRRTA